MNAHGREDPPRDQPGALAMATNNSTSPVIGGDAATAGIAAAADNNTVSLPSTSTDIAEDDDSADAVVSPLADLPPELIGVILDHVPAEEQQRAALAMRHVLPRHQISNSHLWTHLIVHQGRQLTPLWHKLKDEGRSESGATRAVRTFSQESWRGDVDILNNVLRWLPALRTLMLNVGTNFVPEHLQEMFQYPRPDIQRMEMRFRPYVEQASYYQFLKGSYFDSAIETLARVWPESPEFTHLSLVQDPLPRGSAPPSRSSSEVSLIADDMESLGFQSRFPSRFPSRLGSTVVSAAPSVAPSVAPSTIASTTASTVASTVVSAAVSTASSPASSDTEEVSGSDESTPPTSVDNGDLPENKGYSRRGPFPYLSERLQGLKPKAFAQPIVFFDIKCIARFGASPVAKHLTHFRLRVPSRDIAYVLVSPPERTRIFPALRYLDISTTNVRLDAVLATLLRNYERLEHLVLDRVNLFGFKARESGVNLCKELGAMCVSAGLARGKERERLITQWDTAERTRMAQREAERRRTEPADDDDEDGGDDVDEATRAARRAEREAQIMRDEMQRQIQLARSRRGHRSAANAPFSLRDRTGRRGAASNAVTTADLPPTDRAYFVLPPLPTLRTLSIGGETPNLSRFRVSSWEDEFHAGWRGGLATLHGWAVHVAEKYERALKKAAEWRETAAKGAKKAPVKGKGKARTTTAAGGVAAKPPPLDVRLFRFARPDEPVPDFNPDDPTVGLIEVVPSAPRDYLDAYKQAIADAELYTHSHAIAPPCVLCTVPDCEGPLRRGADGERIDGRGGMENNHRAGCGHEVGRQSWGWEGVNAV